MVVGRYGGGSEPVTARSSSKPKVEGDTVNFRQGKVVDSGYRTRRPRIILTQHSARAVDGAGSLQKAAPNRIQPGRLAGTALLLVGDHGRLKLRQKVQVARHLGCTAKSRAMLLVERYHP
jgi:hypothetical protein